MRAPQSDRKAAAADAALVGILLFVSGQFFGSLNGALSKYLTPEMPVLMIVWARFAGFFLIVLIPALKLHGVAAIVPPRPELHFMRGMLLVAATACFVGAVSGMPLANALALVFVYPFLVTALAPVLLGERVALGTWVAVVSGFVGVLVVMRPSPEGVDWHALLAIGGGCAFGLHLLITRRLTASSPPLVLITTSALVGVIVMSATLPFAWQTPTWFQLLVLVGVAAAATAGQALATMACNRTEMSILAPFGYSEIVTATVVGYLLFADFPDRLTWLGIAIIVVSGVYIALAAGSRRLPLISRTRPPAT